MKKFNSLCIILGLLSIFTTNSHAATSSGSGNPLSPPPSDTDELIAGYGTNWQIPPSSITPQSPTGQYYLMMPPYDVANSIAGGSILDFLFSIPYTFTVTDTTPIIIATLTGGFNPNAILNAPGPLLPLPSTAFNVDPGTPTAGTLTQTQQTTMNQGLNFDLNTFLDNTNLVANPGPDYTGTPNAALNQAQMAQSFIASVSGVYNPIPLVDFTSLKNSNGNPVKTTADVATVIQADGNNAPIISYLAGLRTYTAQMAAGLDTLYKLYAERIPVTNPTTLKNIQAAMTPPAGSPLPAPPTNPSVLDARQYLATRRLMDNTWYTNMQAAPPAQVQRQMLFILAEMRAEMFTTQQELERTNALLAVLVLQNAGGSRLTLGQQQTAAQGEVGNIESNQKKAAATPSS